MSLLSLLSPRLFLSTSAQQHVKLLVCGAKEFRESSQLHTDVKQAVKPLISLIACIQLLDRRSASSCFSMRDSLTLCMVYLARA